MQYDDLAEKYVQGQKLSLYLVISNIYFLSFLALLFFKKKNIRNLLKANFMKYKEIRHSFTAVIRESLTFLI